MQVNGRAKGALLGVSVSGAQLQCEVSSSFSYNIEMLPATNPNQGRWRSFIPGVQTWSVTVDGHLLLRSLGADFKTLVESSKQGERIFIRFGTIDGVTPRYAIEGYAYINNLALSAGATEFASWSVTFQGDGEFATDWDEFGLIIDSNPIETAWDLIYDQND